MPGPLTLGNPNCSSNNYPKWFLFPVTLLAWKMCPYPELGIFILNQVQANIYFYAVMPVMSLNSNNISLIKQEQFSERQTDGKLTPIRKSRASELLQGLEGSFKSWGGAEMRYLTAEPACAVKWNVWSPAAETGSAGPECDSCMLISARDRSTRRW